MFIRYNATAKYYEYDTSAGQDGTGPWVILPLDKAQIYNGSLPANVAYTDVRNKFTNQQEIIAAAAGEPFPGIVLEGSYLPADNRKVRIINVNGTLYIQFVNDVVPATVGYGTLQFSRDGTLYVDGEIKGKTLHSLTNTNVDGNLHSIGQLYPGRIDVAGAQASWYLGSHASWGLYTNTGLGLAAGIQAGGGINCNALESANHVRAATGLYDYARGYPIGVWTDFTPAMGNSGLNTNYTCKWMTIGKSLFICMYLNVSVYGTPWTFPLPNGFVASNYSCSPIPYGITGYSCMAQSTPGDSYLRFYSNVSGGAFDPGGYQFAGTAIIPIQ